MVLRTLVQGSVVGHADMSSFVMADVFYSNRILASFAAKTTWRE